MSDKTRALAEQYVRGYHSKSEMSNWDDVIELGLKLAQEVIAESASTARVAQSAPLERDELVSRLKRSIPDLEKKITYVGGKLFAGNYYSGNEARELMEEASPIPNGEEIKLAGQGKFPAAVRSLCMRTGCTNKAGRAALEPYRKL